MISGIPIASAPISSMLPPGANKATYIFVNRYQKLGTRIDWSYDSLISLSTPPVSNVVLLRCLLGVGL